MSDYLDPNNEELLKDFFSEAEQQVAQLEQNILVLEHEPSNRDAIDEMFRAAHTLKGAAGTVQMKELASFTHLVEDVMDAIRNGSVQVNERIIDVLLSSIDVIKTMLKSRMEGSIYTGDISSIQNDLESFLPSKGRAKTPVGSAKPIGSKIESKKSEVEEKKPASQLGKGLSEYEILEMREVVGKDQEIYQIKVRFDESNPMNTVGGIQVFAILKNLGQVLKTDPDFEKLYEDNFYPEVIYYLATNQPITVIQDKLVIPDVVLGTTIESVPQIGTKKAGERTTPESIAPSRVGTEPQTKTHPVATEPVPFSLAKSSKPSEAGEPSAEEVSRVGRSIESPEGREPTKPSSPPAGKIAQGSILRVDSRRIDNLLNLVSEVVISKATFNQHVSQFSETLTEFQNLHAVYTERIKALFDHIVNTLQAHNMGGVAKELKSSLMDKYGDLFTLFEDFETKFKGNVARFRSTSQNLGRIAGELQEGVMRIRMVPISQIFSRFPRLVRDLSRSLQKKINLVIEGEETELDKSVIEDLLDPLIHCVRNAIDHGIEDPDERKAKGKPEEGTIHLRASNEGNLIVIEVSDDGKGIDVEAVRQRAIERGIIHPNKSLSDVEAYNLIFEPGFSTAKTVTNISGRGVGLDVVRKQIEKLNGSVTVTSEWGKGTRFIIKLPLTLAIIQGLLVRVGTERYAIPITSVIDSHRIRPSDIKSIDNYEVFNVREEVVSILRLNRLFRIPSNEQQDYYFVVIVGSGENKMGLVVDSLIGEEDVVIKPLKDGFTNVPGIAGANITGDGTVSLIIDVPQLLELGLKRELEERRRREAVIR
ncbi:MAG: chemotaxis protein CheW [Spirochaetes bacterium]|nr:chemotaxis protein CheW [Spirochaetota bacterium]